MKRSYIIATATLAGLAGVLSYHTVSGTSTAPLAVSAGGAAGRSASSTSTSTSTTAAPASGSSTSSTAAPPSTTTTTSAAKRSAEGDTEQYRYGVLELKVTVQGRRITDVEPVVDEATDPRSQQINSEAIPYLRQQALSAQSANIDGVSGASYTSAAYQASLQSALDKLGVS